LFEEVVLVGVFADEGLVAFGTVYHFAGLGYVFFFYVATVYADAGFGFGAVLQNWGEFEVL
jgi:hypothetical protein